jgi:hypothetical protein
MWSPTSSLTSFCNLIDETGKRETASFLITTFFATGEGVLIKKPKAMSGVSSRLYCSNFVSHQMINFALCAVGPYILILM